MSKVTALLVRLTYKWLIMFPTVTVTCSHNSSRRNVELPCKPYNSPSVPRSISDLIHGDLVQLCAWMAFSMYQWWLAMSAMQNRIIMVRFCGVPSKITYCIVLWVSVSMAAFQIAGIRSDECKKNEFVNRHGMSFPIDADVHKHPNQLPVTPVWNLFENSTFVHESRYAISHEPIYGANPPVIARLISAKARDVLPVFHGFTLGLSVSDINI